MSKTLFLFKGSVDRNELEHNIKYHYNVSKIILHPGFVSDKIPTDDIALIKLSRPVLPTKTKKSIQYAQLKDENRILGTKYNCRAAGRSTIKFLYID